ncbi:hypothetical protein [Pectinatus frisingensis]|uniref:hypothetical protein n=1 Tax=Pectinatus frisingensis TaxID=865 RepID=UPI0018C48377|nr:hypothetical protein [Pectinatus frisingensis]
MGRKAAAAGVAANSVKVEQDIANNKSSADILSDVKDLGVSATALAGESVDLSAVSDFDDFNSAKNDEQKKRK